MFVFYGVPFIIYIITKFLSIDFMSSVLFVSE